MGDKVVGIIGGMGPAATVDLLARIIAATPAKDDADHIRILVDNNPKVPSRIAALVEGTGESPAPTMIAMARGLIDSGAELLAIPCNTAHHYHAELAGAVDAPVLNLVEVAGEFLQGLDPAPAHIGILASDAVQCTDLFGQAFARRGIRVLYPRLPVQARLMGLIRSIKAGSHSQADTAILEAAARDLAGRGAQTLLIACTELSIVAASLTCHRPVYDTAQLLAEEIVRCARSSGPGARA